MPNTAAWAIVALMAILLIVMGFQGSFGKMLAVVFCPGELQVISSSSSSSSSSPIPGVNIGPNGVTTPLSPIAPLTPLF